ncbi:MAG: hypothetical protein HQM05_17250, partial [Magnetococcales bacterium]|nr:hypothetical protein [Magnetococcales bacterium]
INGVESQISIGINDSLFVDGSGNSVSAGITFVQGGRLVGVSNHRGFAAACPATIPGRNTKFLSIACAEVDSNVAKRCTAHKISLTGGTIHASNDMLCLVCAA